MKKILALLLTFTLVFSTVSYSFGQENDQTAGEDTNDEQVILRPLVILMDYQDYTHEQMVELEDKPHVIGVSYDDYEKERYEEMFFGGDTYIGPDGNEYQTFKSYYEKMSNDKYVIDGDVFGWYMAEKDATYYGAQDQWNSDQRTARDLAIEGLAYISKEEGLDLSIYDSLDPNDIDEDGNTEEPDGEIDCVIVVHAGRGEEWGGGSLGSDAIWPYSHKFTDTWKYDDEASEWYPCKKEVVSYGEETILSDSFLIIEQDFPMGLALHEFGHYLGLPDLYNYTGGTPVDTWSNMDNSYAGPVTGALPSSLGAYCREALTDTVTETAIDIEKYTLEELKKESVKVKLSAADLVSSELTDMIRIDLPTRVTSVIQPPSGDYIYYSTTGNWLENDMTTTIDLTDGTSSELTFKALYDIDPGYDYASVQVRVVGDEDWTAVEGNITTTENLNDETPEDSTDRNPGHGITNDSAGEWVDGTFDLSSFTGSKIELRFFWWTDSNTPELGIYLDDIQVTLDEEVVLLDNADSETSEFTLNGFIKDNGNLYGEHYYLLEYRDHQGFDTSLTYSHHSTEESSYNQGLVVWYIDETWNKANGSINQDNSQHHGRLSVGVVDAGYAPVETLTKGTIKSETASARHQIKDAAFSLILEPVYNFEGKTTRVTDLVRAVQPVFSDKLNYFNPDTNATGLILENYGLDFVVLKENTDDRTMTVQISTKASVQETDVLIEYVKTENATVSIKFGSDHDDVLYAMAYGENLTSDQHLVKLTLNAGVYTGVIMDGYKIGAIVLEDDGVYQGIYNNQVFNYGVDFTNLPNQVTVKEEDSEELTTHTVVAGQTLAQIAAMYNINLGQLKKMNPSVKNKHLIFPKQVLNVPENK